MILRVLCVPHFAHRFFYLLFNRTRGYFFGFKLHFSSLTFHMYINNTIFISVQNIEMAAHTVHNFLPARNADAHTNEWLSDYPD